MRNGYTRYTTKWLSCGKLDFPNKKTQVWEVISVKGVFLGDIRWFNSWRQYAFFPGQMTVFNKVCLKDIQEFIGRLMKQRKKILIK